MQILSGGEKKAGDLGFGDKSADKLRKRAKTLMDVEDTSRLVPHSDLSPALAHDCLRDTR